MLVKILKILILVFIFGKTTLAIFEECDFYEEIKPDRSYYLFSLNYPEKYQPGQACRWYIVSPSNTKVELTCKDFYIPPSQECRLDRLSVSLNGRIDLTDVTNYCGEGKISLVSKKNKLNVVLQTVSYSPGGYFFCHLKVKNDKPKPNPLCTCGYTNIERIVGGTETGVNEYPMMAGLIDRVKKHLFCGATIISNKFALTASHCLIQKEPSNVALLVGDHDLSTGSDTDSSKLYRIEKFFLHQNYSMLTYENDVALVAVRDKIEFSRTVGAACLPLLNTKDSFAGETVYALGWGSTFFGGPTAKTLQKVPLDVLTLEQCKPTYLDQVTEKQMCTYKEEKDACQADSGGPLLWLDPKTQVVKVLGIVSYGIHCATKNPSINTRVTSYLDWIKNTTGEDYCVI